MSPSWFGIEEVEEDEDDEDTIQMSAQYWLSFSDATRSVDKKFPDDGILHTEELLTKELNHLSSTEREEVLYDVHGVSNVVEETPEFVARRLEDLNVNICKTRDKAAYDLAEALNKEFVQDRRLRLQFLRSCAFDASWAADRMVRHFEVKQSLFGSDKLAKEITLEDFSKEDIACLESGFGTILPLRDRAGRAVVCFTSCLRYGHSVESRVRNFSLTFQSSIHGL